MKPYATVVGGGTRGHAGPALVIAEELVARGHARESIVLVGSQRGEEGDAFRAAGFPTRLLPGRGINERRVNLANVAGALGLGYAFLLALDMLTRRRPAVVVSAGGFVSLPCGLAAALLRVPIVVTDQNAFPTGANKVVSRFARACAAPFDGSGMPNATTTGNPLDTRYLALPSRDAARRALGLPQDRRIVLAFGSSLGTRSINLAVAELAERWEHRDDLAVRHVWGRRDWAMAAPARDGSEGIVYQPVEFENRMPEALAAADIAVCRAGGNTISELAMAGLPALLVPLPIAIDDHQTANARVLERVGAGVIVSDPELDAARVERELTRLLDDAAQLKTMSDAARSVARPDAAERVADLVEAHARA